MTHATKAIYKLLLSDYVKVSKVSVEDMLFDEQDILRSMDKIEVGVFLLLSVSDAIQFWEFYFTFIKCYSLLFLTFSFLNSLAWKVLSIQMYAFWFVRLVRLLCNRSCLPLCRLLISIKRLK